MFSPNAFGKSETVYEQTIPGLSLGKSKVRRATDQTGGTTMKHIFSKSTLPALCWLTVAAPALAGPHAAPFGSEPSTAAAPIDASASTMNFLSSPAIAVNGYAFYPHVVQVRNSDTTNVIVHQPAACGERLRDASFEVEGNWLLLRYAAPYKGAWTSDCISTGMFVFRGLPPGAVQVVALPEPVPVGEAAVSNETSSLRMGFLASPAIAPVPGRYASYPHVVQVQSSDVTNIIVHQPVACGERLRDASFELEGDWLLLRYAAPYAGNWESECVSTGMYTFRGLPGRNIQVVALPEPVPVVTSASVPVGPPALRMGFLASPAIPVPGYPAFPDVVQVRNGDTANVIVHQPAACGERLRDAAFELQDNWLLLRYSAPYASNSKNDCVSTGMFVFRGLPAGNIQVVAQPEAVSIPPMVARK